jgi:hypothetical protein
LLDQACGVRPDVGDFDTVGSFEMSERMQFTKTSPDPAVEETNKLIVNQFTMWKESGDLHKVIVKVELNLVSEFETSQSKCFVDVGVRLWWYDPMFVGAAAGHVSVPRHGFKPELEFSGGREHFKKMVRKADGGHIHMDASCSPHGIVHSYQRYRGYVQQGTQLHCFCCCFCITCLQCNGFLFTTTSA